MIVMTESQDRWKNQLKNPKTGPESVILSGSSE
jgi:hypothetical protein